MKRALATLEAGARTTGAADSGAFHH